MSAPRSSSVAARQAGCAVRALAPRPRRRRHAARPRTHEALQVLLGAAHHLACGSSRAGSESGAAGRLARRAPCRPGPAAGPGPVPPCCPRSCRAPKPPAAVLLPHALQRAPIARPPCAAAGLQTLLAGAPWLLAAPGRRQAAAAADAATALTCCVCNTPGSLCTMLACRKRTGAGGEGRKRLRSAKHSQHIPGMNGLWHKKGQRIGLQALCNAQLTSPGHV